MSDHHHDNSKIQRALHSELVSFDSTTTNSLFPSSPPLSWQPQHRRRRQGTSFPFLLLIVSYLFTVEAFSSPSSSFSSSTSFVPRPSFSRGIVLFENNNYNNHRGRQNTMSNYGRMQMSSVADVPASSSSSESDSLSSSQSSSSSSKSSPSSKASATRLSDFQRRMKGLIKRNNNIENNNNFHGSSSSSSPGTVARSAAPIRRTFGTKSSPNSSAGGAAEKPANLKTVVTLEEYKEVLDANREKVIVVRFFATWCKACKAIQPSYYRMAHHYPNNLFLEVPVTNHNANLHQGLGVPSLPYGHIYYPEAGLVEEMKISKKYFGNLVKRVRWYEEGSCGVDETLVAEDEEGNVANGGAAVVNGGSGGGLNGARGEDGESCDAMGNGDCK